MSFRVHDLCALSLLRIEVARVFRFLARWCRGRAGAGIEAAETGAGAA